MKINKYDARATQDITIDELPKQDNPNNSDLIPIQGSSLTEATSIQQLRNKILSGSDASVGTIGTYLFSASKIESPNYLLMDGTQYNRSAYPTFYDWINTQSNNLKQFFTLDTVAQTFKLPDFKDLGMKVKNADTASVNRTVGVPQHCHLTETRYLSGYWVTLNTGNRPLTARDVAIYAYPAEVEEDGFQILSQTTNAIPKDRTSNTELSDIDYKHFGCYCYIKVEYDNNSNVVASPYIKSDGTISMNLDYTPTDVNDVATKKYIDNKFLNYEIPLAFSINDIGKRIPYYKNADNNPTLIALDGTKYLIADYPDFDYATQEGFTNDGVYFWFANLRLEVLSAISVTNPDEVVDGYIGFAVGNNPIIFNSKLVYNFLQTPTGAALLVADGVGKDKDNYGFTILDVNNYKIRMNTISTEIARIIYGGLNQNFIYKENGLGINQTGLISVTGGRYLLKIQPDYMVAKIQQVGSVAGAGDVKADRSVLLTGAGVFNSKQVASMDDLTASNIIVGDSVRVITTLDSKLNQIDTNITALQSSIPSFKIAQSRRLVKPNTNIIEIAGQGRLFPIDSFIPTTITGYESDTFTIETFNGKKVIKEKMDNGIVTRHLNIRLSLGHTASMTSKKIELAVYLFRGSQTGLDDNSAIATGSSMLFYDTDARGQSTNLLSVVVNGVNDFFVTEGWFIVLKSLNPSADKLIFSKGDILINIVNSN